MIVVYVILVMFVLVVFWFLVCFGLVMYFGLLFVLRCLVRLLGFAVCLLICCLRWSCLCFMFLLYFVCVCGGFGVSDCVAFGFVCFGLIGYVVCLVVGLLVCNCLVGLRVYCCDSLLSICAGFWFCTVVWMVYLLCLL